MKKLTNARSGGRSSFNGSGAAKQDQTGTLRLGGSNCSEGVSTTRTRRVLIGIPESFQSSIGGSRVKPRFRPHQFLKNQRIREKKTRTLRFSNCGGGPGLPPDPLNLIVQYNRVHPLPFFLTCLIFQIRKLIRDRYKRLRI